VSQLHVERDNFRNKGVQECDGDHVNDQSCHRSRALDLFSKYGRLKGFPPILDCMPQQQKVGGCAVATPT
jgi:hypothetical protein